MPSGALVDRAEEQACLMVIAHKRQTSNEFSDLLNSIKIENLSKNESRQISLMKKELKRLDWSLGKAHYSSSFCMG